MPIVAPQSGRVTKGAAKVLLGKVYLENGEFQNSAAKLAEVIEGDQNYGYALHDNFRDNWQEETENGIESILSIEFMDPPGNPMSAQLNAPKYSIHEGAGVPGINNANEADIPTVELYNLFSDSDERKGWTFKMEYLSPVDNQIYIATIPLFGKYWEEGETNLNEIGTNYHILRYADALLTYSEALNQIGETGKAITYLNKIRERAYNSAEFNFSEGEGLGQAILQERKLEFAYEGHRWFDLVRAGKLVETMEAHGRREAELAESNKTEISANIRQAHTLYPIPQREIDLNPELTQNPGY